MARRGLTLVELLAVLAILVVLSGLAWPAVESRLEDARMDAAGRGLEAAIILARAEAQRRGTMVTLEARPGRDGQTILTLGGSGEPAARSVAPLAVIGSGVSLSRTPPAADAPAAVHAVPAAAAEAAPEPLTIARFMPDGTAMAPGPIYLSSAGRTVSYTVNRWTGSARATPFVADGSNADDPNERSDQEADIGAPPPASPAPTGSEGALLTLVLWPRRMGRRQSRTRRGALLLELVLALAIFVVAGSAILMLVDRTLTGTMRLRQQERAADLARSAMARIEAGIDTPMTLNGPVPPWRDEETPDVGGGLASSAAPETGWELRIDTEPSQFRGLTRVTVTAQRRREGQEQPDASYTLHQLVRLSPQAEDRAGEEGDLSEAAKRGLEELQRRGSAGGSR